MTPEEQILFGDLGLDAIRYAERALLAFDVFSRAEIAAAMQAGAAFKVTVNFYGDGKGKHPRFSLVQVLADGREVELHATGQEGGMG